MRICRGGVQSLLIMFACENQTETGLFYPVKYNLDNFRREQVQRMLTRLLRTSRLWSRHRGVDFSRCAKHQETR